MNPCKKTQAMYSRVDSYDNKGHPNPPGSRLINLDRFHFAVLKLRKEDFGRLKQAVEMAKRDWRNLLTALGFAHDVAVHKR